jgi:hypothetical protein
VSQESEADEWYERHSFDLAQLQNPPPYNALCGRLDPGVVGAAESFGIEGSCNEHGSGVESTHGDTERRTGLYAVCIRQQAHYLSPPPVAITRFRSMDGLLIESRWERDSIV